MATGILGQADLSASTNTTLYTVPADTFAVITVNVCNRSGTDKNIRVAVAAGGTPSNAEYLEYDVTLLPNGVLERGGIVMNAGKNLVVYADATDVSVSVYGIETELVAA